MSATACKLTLHPEMLRARGQTQQAGGNGDVEICESLDCPPPTDPHSFRALCSGACTPRGESQVRSIPRCIRRFNLLGKCVHFNRAKRFKTPLETPPIHFFGDCLSAKGEWAELSVI